MKLRMRDAVASDAIMIASHNQAMAYETEHEELDIEITLAGVRAVLNDLKLGRYLVAELGNKVVGNLMITYEWSDWRNRMMWWIQSVYVKPEFRGQGVYTAMHRHVLRLAEAEKGCRKSASTPSLTTKRRTASIAKWA